MNAVPRMHQAVAAAVFIALLGCQCATAVDLPKRKPGQWQITLTSDDPRVPARTEDVCLDAATDALLDRFALGASRQLCSRFDWKRLDADRASVEAECKLGATQMTIRGDVAFVGDTAYREQIRTHYDPPLRGRSDRLSVHEARWMGACAPDMKPGDVVSRPSPMLPTGMKINLKDVAGAEQAAR